MAMGPIAAYFTGRAPFGEEARRGDVRTRANSGGDDPTYVLPELARPGKLDYPQRSRRDHSDLRLTAPAESRLSAGNDCNVNATSTSKLRRLPDTNLDRAEP